MYEQIIKICKQINDEASSSTLVEDLASYEKEINKRLNYFIKIKILTKELEFNTPKTKKNTKTTKNGALGMSLYIYNDKIWYL